MGLADAPLMVAKHSNFAIGAIVRKDFIRDRCIFGSLLELLLKGPRRVVGTEDLGGQARHVFA